MELGSTKSSRLYYIITGTRKYLHGKEIKMHGMYTNITLDFVFFFGDRSVFRNRYTTLKNTKIALANELI